MCCHLSSSTFEAENTATQKEIKWRSYKNCYNSKSARVQPSPCHLATFVNQHEIREV